MQTPRAFLGVASLDNLVYAVGGYNEQDSFLDSVEFYSPITRCRRLSFAVSVSCLRSGLCVSPRLCLSVCVRFLPLFPLLGAAATSAAGALMMSKDDDDKG
jgi:hypothetical protein